MLTCTHSTSSQPGSRRRLSARPAWPWQGRRPTHLRQYRLGRQPESTAVVVGQSDSGPPTTTQSFGSPTEGIPTVSVSTIPPHFPTANEPTTVRPSEVQSQVPTSPPTDTPTPTHTDVIPVTILQRRRHLPDRRVNRPLPSPSPTAPRTQPRLRHWDFSPLYHRALPSRRAASMDDPVLRGCDTGSPSEARSVGAPPTLTSVGTCAHPDTHAHHRNTGHVTSQQWHQRGVYT